jgi:tetratricopeptide (TPR) repeat protein
VRADPGSPLHHQAAWDLASSLGTLDAYVSVVEALLSDERADSSALVRCELLLRLGEVLEKERHDLDRAAALYGQAGATGVRTVDVWRAQARVAGARGDASEQLRLLGHLANLGQDQAETRADALYRLAEVQLAAADTLEEGLASLQKGLADALAANPPRTERAAMILRRACDQHRSHERLLDVYEQVARRSDDKHTLLHYLERRAGHPSATPEQAKEAVDVALELGEHGKIEDLMLRAAEIGHGLERAEDLGRIDWALLGLAERRMVAGDLAGSVKWLSEATEVASLDSVLSLSEKLAELAGAPDGDLTLAAKVYERIVERAPEERRAWEPLASINSRLDDVERLERMVEETPPSRCCKTCWSRSPIRRTRRRCCSTTSNAPGNTRSW